MQEPVFWQDKDEGVKASEELSRLKEEVKSLDDIFSLVERGEELIEYAEKDEELSKELDATLIDVEKKIVQEEVALYFSGQYDKNNAIITIYSGAGGLDAQNWAGMLLRMYERYCALRGYKGTVISKSFG